MQKNYFSEEKMEALFTADQCGILNLDDVFEDINKMKESKILEEHIHFCEIWQATDGRWKTKLPDTNKKDGKRLIAKTSKIALEKAVIKWYKEQQNQSENPRTLETLYPHWLTYKDKDTSHANANKLAWVWNTYYKDSTIIKTDVVNLKVIDLKNWFLDMIAAHSLTSRKFKEMKSVINMLLDYAIEKELIVVNVARSVRSISYKKFAHEEEKDTTKKVYVNDEQEQIISLALAQYKKTLNVAYLAVCLNFTLALRVGELVALHNKDFFDDTVYISRQEIKTFEKRGTNYVRTGYTLVEHTKTLQSTRDLFLTSRANEFLEMIIEANKQRGFKNGYLLIDAKGNRIHDYSVNNA